MSHIERAKRRIAAKYDIDDTTLARYAVECFTVLEAWCSKVNWSGGAE